VKLPILRDAEALGAILDAYPAPSLVVDKEVRTLFINRAARRALGLQDEQMEPATLRRSGHHLHCVHAGETPEGCGSAPACRRCALQDSVGSAFAAEAVRHSRAILHLVTPNGLADVQFRISAAPVRRGDFVASILTLESVSDVFKVTSLIPICFHCRKVKDEEHGWQTVEDYFKHRADIDFSHALCTDCLKQHYPEEAPDCRVGPEP